MGMEIVDEEEYGLYIWVDGQGRRIADADNNTLNIPSKRGDRQRIIALRDAARHYGIMDGKPVFLSNKRRVTDSEHQYQHERLRAGLIPDPLDFRALEEEQEYARKFGG